MKYLILISLIGISTTVFAVEETKNESQMMQWLPIAGRGQSSGEDRIKVYISPDSDASGKMDLFIHYGGYVPVVGPIKIELSSKGKVVYKNDDVIDMNKVKIGMIRIKIKLDDVDITGLSVSKLTMSLK